MYIFVLVPLFVQTRMTRNFWISASCQLFIGLFDWIIFLSTELIVLQIFMSVQGQGTNMRKNLTLDPVERHKP